MPLFGRSSPQSPERTPEERERARVDREARRGSLTGASDGDAAADAAGLPPSSRKVSPGGAAPAPAVAAPGPPDLAVPASGDGRGVSPDLAAPAHGEGPPAQSDGAAPVPGEGPPAQPDLAAPAPDPPDADAFVPENAADGARPPGLIRIQAPGGAEPIVERGEPAGEVPTPRRRPHLRRGAPRARPRPVRPRRPLNARRIAARVVALVVVLGLVAVAVLAVLAFQPFHGSGHGRVSVVIPKGVSARQIGNDLADHGVVSSGFFFALNARLSGRGSNIRPGRYSLALGMSYSAALDALDKGPLVVPTVTVTIAPGMDRVGIAKLVRADGLRGSYVEATRRSPRLDPAAYGAPRGVSLEGFLFPDTFQLRAGAPVLQLVDDQLADFKRHFASVSLAGAHRLHLSAYDVLIVASMVEKEALLDRERPLIAAVIYNRLRQHTPLGIDATILYGLGGDFSRPLTDADLALNTPYNTRLRDGLPPTPIANPGLASLRAAADPAHVPYLFYVVKPGTCGEDAFTTSYQQFLADAKRYQSAKAANGGRSPQSCRP
jgi:uncharacterized YceG family protein